MDSSPWLQRAWRESGAVKEDPHKPRAVALDVAEGFVPLSSGNISLALHRRFTLYVDESDCPPLAITVEIGDDANYRCTRLVVGERDEHGVTSDDLRLPLSRIIESALPLVTEPLHYGEPSTEDLIRRHHEPSPTPEQRESDVAKAWRDTRSPPGRGNALTDDFLREVAQVYREASKRGQPPTRTVKEAFHGSRSSAGRWVTEARKRGLLGKAPSERQAGEQE